MNLHKMTVNRISETFDLLTEWEDRYQFIIELGDKIATMDEELHTEQNLVKECMSQAWIVVQKGEQETIELLGDSDNNIIKGIVALLVIFYSDKSSEEALLLDPDEQFKRWGIYEHLSPNRHVGVYAMVARIKKAIAKIQNI